MKLYKEKMQLIKVAVLFLGATLISALVNAQTIPSVKYGNILIPVKQYLGKKVSKPVGPFCGENEKPRVIVALDYGDITKAPESSSVPQNKRVAGDANEPQDLAYFLLYSNYFDVRGFIATERPGKGNVEFITHALREFSTYDIPTLNNYLVNDSWYGDSSRPFTKLNSNLVKKGIANKFPKSPNSSFNFKSESSVKLILEEARKLKNEIANGVTGKDCKLNIMVWGASTEVAAALFEMRGTDANLKKYLRILAVGSSNRNPNLNGDDYAWTYLKQNEGPSDFIEIENIFRDLYLSGHCTDKNRPLYSGTSGTKTPKELMNALTSYQPISGTIDGRGLNKLIQDSRIFADWYNCQRPKYSAYPRKGDAIKDADRSHRMGDFITVLYFFDKVVHLNMENLIRDDQRGSLDGRHLDWIYDDYMKRMRYTPR
ncbi:hypothetical protein TDB9533_00790 [Thalassocella blandensis]|nr:hypothetical protein TDB9533_00790 [Thalassocella blandensis]